MKLPIIDVNALTPSEITARVRLACETNGFFILRNHPVKQSTIREMHVASKLFYALPVKFKMRAKQNANNRGYSPICLLYTSPSPRDRQKSRMPSSA